MARNVSNRIASERALGLLCLALAFATPRAAHADAKQCISSNEKANALRKDGKLRAARDEFAACAVDSCPKMVREECGRLLTQINAAIPSLVFAATDANGNDITKAKVELDGENVTDSLDGRSIAVDPGEHHVVLTTEDGITKEVDVVAREGERNRRVDIKLASPSEEPEPPVVAPTPQEPPAQDSSRGGPPVAAWILGGVGVVAVGGFALFALDGKSKEKDLKDQCAPNCDQGHVDKMRKSYLFADISLGVAVVSLGAATYLFVSSSPKKEKVGVTPPVIAVGPRSAGVSWGGRF